MHEHPDQKYPSLSFVALWPYAKSLAIFSLDPILMLVEYDVAVGGGVNEWAELRKGDLFGIGMGAGTAPGSCWISWIDCWTTLYGSERSSEKNKAAQKTR